MADEKQVNQSTRDNNLDNSNGNVIIQNLNVTGDLSDCFKELLLIVGAGGGRGIDGKPNKKLKKIIKRLKKLGEQTKNIQEELASIRGDIRSLRLTITETDNNTRAILELLRELNLSGLVEEILEGVKRVISNSTVVKQAWMDGRLKTLRESLETTIHNVQQAIEQRIDEAETNITALINKQFSALERNFVEPFKREIQTISQAIIEINQNLEHIEQLLSTEGELQQNINQIITLIRATEEELIRYKEFLDSSFSELQHFMREILSRLDELPDELQAKVREELTRELDLLKEHLPDKEFVENNFNTIKDMIRRLERDLPPPEPPSPGDMEFEMVWYFVRDEETTKILDTPEHLNKRQGIKLSPIFKTRRHEPRVFPLPEETLIKGIKDAMNKGFLTKYNPKKVCVCLGARVAGTKQPWKWDCHHIKTKHPILYNILSNDNKDNEHLPSDVSNLTQEWDLKNTQLIITWSPNNPKEGVTHYDVRRRQIPFDPRSNKTLNVLHGMNLFQGWKVVGEKLVHTQFADASSEITSIINPRRFTNKEQVVVHPDISFEYEVRAVNKFGPGEWTKIPKDPNLSPPRNITHGPLEDGSIKIVWSPVQPIRGQAIYIVERLKLPEETVQLITRPKQETQTIEELWREIASELRKTNEELYRTPGRYGTWELLSITENTTYIDHEMHWQNVIFKPQVLNRSFSEKPELYLYSIRVVNVSVSSSRKISLEPQNLNPQDTDNIQQAVTIQQTNDTPEGGETPGDSTSQERRLFLRMLNSDEREITVEFSTRNVFENNSFEATSSQQVTVIHDEDKEISIPADAKSFKILGASIVHAYKVLENETTTDCSRNPQPTGGVVRLGSGAIHKVYVSFSFSNRETGIHVRPELSTGTGVNATISCTAFNERDEQISAPELKQLRINGRNTVKFMIIPQTQYYLLSVSRGAIQQAGAITHFAQGNSTDRQNTSIREGQLILFGKEGGRPNRLEYADVKIMINPAEGSTPRQEDEEPAELEPQTSTISSSIKVQIGLKTGIDSAGRAKIRQIDFPVHIYYYEPQGKQVAPITTTKNNEDFTFNEVQPHQLIGFYLYDVFRDPSFKNLEFTINEVGFGNSKFRSINDEENTRILMLSGNHPTAPRQKILMLNERRFITPIEMLAGEQSMYLILEKKGELPTPEEPTNTRTSSKDRERFKDFVRKEKEMLSRVAKTTAQESKASIKWSPQKLYGTHRQLQKLITGIHNSEISHLHKDVLANLYTQDKKKGEVMDQFLKEPRELRRLLTNYPDLTWADVQETIEAYIKELEEAWKELHSGGNSISGNKVQREWDKHLETKELTGTYGPGKREF